MKDGAFILVKTTVEPVQDEEDFFVGADYPFWVDDARYTYKEYTQRYDELRGFKLYYATYLSVGQDTDTERYVDHLQLVKQTLTGA